MSLGLSRMGVMAQGSKGVCLKEDRLQSLPILGEPGKPNSSRGSLSWVSPAGAEYLPLTPKHADPLLGTLAWEPWGAVFPFSPPSSHLLVSSLLSPLLFSSPRGLGLPAGGGGGGTKAVAPDNAGSPLTRIGRAGRRGWARAFAYAALAGGGPAVAERAGAEPRACAPRSGPLSARCPRDSGAVGAAQLSARRPG